MSDTGALASAPRKRALRDLSGLSLAVIVSLAIHLVIVAAMLALTAGILGQVGGLPVDAYPTRQDPFAGIDGSTYSLVSLLHLADFVINGVLVLVWIYQVSRNAHVLARGLNVSPAGAVGWYFVPIVTFWKPFEAMNETWRASASAQGWRHEPTPALLRVWWGLWLLNRLAGSIGGQILLHANTTESLRLALGVNVVGLAAGLPLDVVFILMVRQLTTLQKAAVHEGIFD